MLDVYNNISRMRLKHGMTQAELADKVGYTSPSAIARLEAGKTDIPLSKLLRIADCFNTTVSELLGENNNVSSIISLDGGELTSTSAEPPALRRCLQLYLNLDRDKQISFASIINSLEEDDRE